jgi:hypothetical protein
VREGSPSDFILFLTLRSIVVFQGSNFAMASNSTTAAVNFSMSIASKASMSSAKSCPSREVEKVTSRSLYLSKARLVATMSWRLEEKEGEGEGE